ncbi:hypothetical protein EVAR_40481_1 [Eumeta japonica]|uniref:Uncharacterized protein n=1 Tax=Eumeta variegata TaxID=151549 RepID=A0A4C1XX32_EUMVA|nr:hypothetical protein EVAR_40481_1 [Eumeta japonica]
MDMLSVKCLLYADDQIILLLSACELHMSSMFVYGNESWVHQKKNDSRINALEMRSLRSMCGVSREVDVGTLMSESSVV